MTDTVSRTTDAAPAPAADGDPGASYAQLVDELRATFRRGHTRPLEWRRTQLEAIVRMLTDHEDDFVRALQEDLGRGETEAYGMDVGFTKTEVKHLLKHLPSWMKPSRAPVGLTSMPGKGRVVPEPLGVALVIAPWNYPVQLLVSPMAAAIAAGNCVVAKPSELAPACSAVLARLIPRYLDDRAVVVVEGGVPETTALLAQRYDHVFFTGSTRVGRVVMEAAAKHLTPVTLELGGKSPTIVAADADLDVAARRIIWGKSINAGQTCIAPDYVLAEASIRDRLVDTMIGALREFYGPDPKTSRDFARIVNESHLRRLERYLADHGGTVVVGGDVDAEQRYLSPTIVVDPDPSSALMTDEIFGPILPVLSVESIDDAVDFVVDRPKPLALYVFSSSDETVDDVLARTSSGGACVNHVVLHIAPNAMPFGGVGPSGMGAYHGKAGFDAFSHHKSVLYKPQKPDPNLLYPPYTPLKSRVIRAAM
ncbi:MAG: aldehyde dehydrogenase family protein [Acidimicrobiales bacterium]